MTVEGSGSYTKRERFKALPFWFKLVCPLSFILPWAIAFYLYFHSSFTNHSMIGLVCFVILHTPIVFYSALEIASVKWLRENGYL